MNPSDANSHLATLRQLKEMLDAGTLTSQEFEALKQQLVFGNSVSAAGSGVHAAADTLNSPPVPSPAPAPLPLLVSEEPRAGAAPASEAAAGAASPDWLAAPVPPLVNDSSEEIYFEEEERRNPLTLVFAIGGGLLLLSIILYLVLGRSASTDEHLTSTSQTAADSTATAPEVGPQTQQITLAPTAPETIRVAPATPPPTATVPAGFRTDSVAMPKATAPVAPPAPAVLAPPAKAATPAKAVPPPAATPDSAKVGQL